MQITNSILLDSSDSQSARELALSDGVGRLSDEHLVMLILGKCQSTSISLELASKITQLIDTSSRDGLVSALARLEGSSEDSALALAAALELGRRKNAIYRAQIRSPSDVTPFLKHYALKPVEYFIVVSLNGAMDILSTKVISVGSVDKALVLPRDVFSEPVALHAAGIICCHNHTGTNCTPSEPDLKTTRLLQQAAKVLSIAFLDHIIITKDAQFSFLDHGLLDSPPFDDEGLFLA